MDMSSASSGHDHAEDPIKVHHPEEGEHHETGASKMFRRVKARAKKFKNSITNHGNDNEEDQNVDEEDDESDDQPLEVTKVEAKPLRDTSYGHEASSPPVRDAPSPPLRVSDLSDREEIREPLNTHVSPLSETEDITTRTLAPSEQKVDIETLKEDPTGGLDYLSGESKLTDPTKKGYEEAGVPETVESLGRVKVTDDEHKTESGIGKYSSKGFEGESGTELREDFLVKSHDFDKEMESGIGKDSPTGDFPEERHELGLKDVREGDQEPLNTPVSLLSETEDVTMRTFDTGEQTVNIETAKEDPADYLSGVSSYEAKVTKEGCGEAVVPEIIESLGRTDDDQKTESGIGKYSSTGFEGESGTELREDFLAKSHEFDQQMEAGITKDSPTGFEGQSGTELREDFPGERHELGLKEECGLGRDLPTEKMINDGLEKKFSGRNDDLEVGTELPMGTHDRSKPKEEAIIIDDPKPSTYTKNATFESFLEGETPVDEKVMETGTNEVTKLPVSEEKRIPGEEDKALWESLKEERKQGEAATEEGKGGGGMVEKIKGTVTSWFGGAAEEVKPKSPDSPKDSAQSLGSTTGKTRTKGFPDSDESGMGVTTGGTGAVPV